MSLNNWHKHNKYLLLRQCKVIAAIVKAPVTYVNNIAAN